MARFDTIIRGGTVIDDTKTARRITDIGIRDGRIAEIGDLAASGAAQVLRRAHSCGTGGLEACPPA